MASLQYQNQRWRWTVFWAQQAEKRRRGRASCGHSVVASRARVICALLLPCLSRYDVDDDDEDDDDDDDDDGDDVESDDDCDNDDGTMMSFPPLPLSFDASLAMAT